MIPTSQITCTHDRGRGTIVCLRCRHDEWQAAQKRRQQMLMRILGVAAVGCLIGVAGVAGAITLREGGALSKTGGPSIALRQEGHPVANPLPRSSSPRVVRAMAAPSSTTAPSAVEPVASATIAARIGGAESVLSQGRTTLADSIFAVRSGDSVSVNFDTQGNRTRRADKFERMVRQTLPLVYGRIVVSALDSVPEGLLLPSRDVVGALMSQGLHFQLANGARIGLWPQTRESNTGPLVVAYLVVPEH
jgi:hypothetical protein